MLNYSVIISSFSVLLSCSQTNSNIEGYTFSGATQGTTYSIIIAEDEINFEQSEIDDLLAEFDTIFSTYIGESHITRLNNSIDNYSFRDNHFFFRTCYGLSQEVFEKSEGLFDPSVYSLVKAWGFFNKEENVPELHQVDSILQFTGFEKNKFHSVNFVEDSIHFIKLDPRFKLDFNGIAQGYSVDVVADFIESRGHQNYYIEIGGELRLKGKNREGLNWKIGIDTPSEFNTGEDREIITTLALSDCGVATSGNYRNFFEKDGKKYGHTLHPKTGRPVLTDILSATVIAENAALADAYATVFMILGKQKSIDFASNQPNIKILLVYVDDRNEINIYQSDGLISS